MERMMDSDGYGSADSTMSDPGMGMDEPRSPRKATRPRKKAAKARKPARRKARAKAGASRKRRKTAKKRRR